MMGVSPLQTMLFTFGRYMFESRHLLRSRSSDIFTKVGINIKHDQTTCREQVSNSTVIFDEINPF